ncbi:MAG: META domain-containing protein [Candidatus Competibacteraceae bacterium]
MAPVLVLAGEADMTMLEGATWRLASVAHADGELQTVPDSVEATATFAAGAVSGSGGCNRFTAGYTLEGDRLTIERGASTMMACPEPQATVEQAFMAALEATKIYRIENGGLVLLDAGSQEIATFKPLEPAALTGVTWRAIFYNNGRGAAVSVLDGSTITATFDADGRVSGSAGCNRYHAAYTVDGSSITIQAPASTRMACSKPEGVMQQEQEYLNALPTAAAYAIHGEQLELRTAEGALVASFQTGDD